MKRRGLRTSLSPLIVESSHYESHNAHTNMLLGFKSIARPILTGQSDVPRDIEFFDHHALIYEEQLPTDPDLASLITELIPHGTVPMLIWPATPPAMESYTTLSSSTPPPRIRPPAKTR